MLEIEGKKGQEVVCNLFWIIGFILFGEIKKEKIIAFSAICNATAALLSVSVCVYEKEELLHVLFSQPVLETVSCLKGTEAAQQDRKHLSCGLKSPCPWNFHGIASDKWNKIPTFKKKENVMQFRSFNFLCQWNDNPQKNNKQTSWRTRVEHNAHISDFLFPVFPHPFHPGPLYLSFLCYMLIGSVYFLLAKSSVTEVKCWLPWLPQCFL